MKKQVTFAESWTVHRLHQEEALPRFTGMNESKVALNDAGVNFSRCLKILRPPAARCEPQLHHVTTKQIPQTSPAGPFLKHMALTPAQREFLYTITASYSAAHARNLITQHYRNVLRRFTRAGDKPDLVETSVTVRGTDESDEQPSQLSAGAKLEEKKSTSERNPGKSFLPKIPNRRGRLSNSSVSKQRKMKKSTTTSPTGRRRRRAGIKLLEEEEEEEGLDDSLSGCLSSFSLSDSDL